MTAERTAALLRDGRGNLRGELLPGMPACDEDRYRILSVT
jgi:hypothetical protein